MPRIPDEFLDCAIYLYPSVAAANAGEKIGGSGFLVSIPSATFPAVGWTYAVTNRHVIEDGKSPVVRLNTVDGGFDVLPIDSRMWRTHPNGDDVAICPLGLDNQHVYRQISVDGFATRSEIDKWAIGLGDDVFIVGRFVSHDGIQRNQPSVRFGNLAMMPGDPVRQETGHLQISYLVEGHSVSGYSGSPVFVNIPPFSDRPSSKTLSHESHIRLLGVDWGHYPDWRPVLVGGRRHPDKSVVKGNAGFIGVVPAWILLELLNAEDLVEMREKQESALKEQRIRAGVLDSVKVD